MPADLVQEQGQFDKRLFRARLIHKGLIYAPDHGIVAFTVPGMAGFIDRQIE